MKKFIPLTIVTVALSIHSMPLALAKYGESCKTPAGDDGKCVPLRSCAGALEVIETAYLYGKEKFEEELSVIYKSRCGGSSELPNICCANAKIQINSLVYERLQNQSCGTSYGKRVSQGEKAELFQYRWMALLKYEGKEQFACGGSLIDDRHVLTAAHCLNNFTNLPIAVRLGEYGLDTELDCLKYGTRTKCLDQPQDIGIKQYIVHEDYVYKSIHHDIAILRLERPVNLNTKSITTICLPISADLRTSIPEEYQVAGWGQTEFGKRSNVLLWTSIPFRENEVCNALLGVTLSDEHICAGGRHFRDTCKGDSGGPLFNTGIYVDGVARSVQYGIVSLGAYKCGEMNVPAVYMNLPYYMQWITDHMIVGDDEIEDDKSNVVLEYRSSALEVIEEPFTETSAASRNPPALALLSLLLFAFSSALVHSK